MKITFFGQATFLLDDLLIDPFIKDNPHTDTNPADIKCNIICVTHKHMDHDADVIEIAKANCEFSNVEFLNIDISEFNEKVDMVIQNPPFGVQNRKADKPFLEKAMQVADKIYTIHKIESKRFVNALCEENKFLINGIIGFDFPIKKSMEFHKKKEHKVRVGCWILEKRKL